MAKQRSGDTREKLLHAASIVFVEKGFRDATVAEICKRASANISAVNYYFGSKEALYQEAWRHAFAEAVEAHPADGGVSNDAPAEERLHGQVRALIRRIADENSRDFLISQREFINPTGLLEDVMRLEFIPLREKTLAVMRDLLGPDASEEQVAFCETAVLSMCFHPMVLQKAGRRVKSAEAPVLITDLEAYARSVVKFALAGIAAVRGDSSLTGLSVRRPDVRASGS